MISQRMALFFGAISMVLVSGITEATPLNHYSDYGVTEQSASIKNTTVSINNDPFGYSDEYTDNESGLQYLQVRYYDPVIMRFIAMDAYPLLNRYAYADENPIMKDDPSGHSAVGANNSQFSTGGIIAKVGSAVIGMTSGLLLSCLSMNPMVVAGIGIIIAGGMSASQTGINEAINHQKASVLNIAESFGIGVGMAAASEVIFGGIGYGLKKLGSSAESTISIARPPISTDLLAYIGETEIDPLKEFNREDIKIYLEEKKELPRSHPQGILNKIKDSPSDSVMNIVSPIRLSDDKELAALYASTYKIVLDEDNTLLFDKNSDFLGMLLIKEDSNFKFEDVYKFQHKGGYGYTALVESFTKTINAANTEWRNSPSV